VFWVLLSSSKHSGVPEDPKSQLFQVLGFTPTLGQSRVATESDFGDLGKCHWYIVLMANYKIYFKECKASHSGLDHRKIYEFVT